MNDAKLEVPPPVRPQPQSRADGAIADPDADVTSIEAARSHMEVLDDLNAVGFANSVGTNTKGPSRLTARVRAPHPCGPRNSRQPREEMRRKLHSPSDFQTVFEISRRMTLDG